MQRGTVVIAHEVRSFRPCGESRELWLVPTPELSEAARALAPAPGGPIYVELHGDIGPAPAVGFGADYPAQLITRELLRAAPATETHGCAEDLRGVEFRAAGNEPFWSVEVASGRLRLRRPGQAESDRPVGPARATREGWSYRPPAGADDAEAFQLVLERGPCADSMVGTRTHWRAHFELDGVGHHGCAWAGEASP
jgi:putative lipoprotein